MRFDDLPIADWEIKDHRLNRLARDVIARMPEQYADGFTVFSVWEGPSREGARVDSDAIYLDPGKFSSWPDDVAVGVLSHEFAHCCLRHAELGNPGLKQEEEADQLASEWGFQQEVHAMRAELGEPTEDPHRGDDHG